MAHLYLNANTHMIISLLTGVQLGEPQNKQGTPFQELDLYNNTLHH